MSLVFPCNLFLCGWKTNSAYVQLISVSLVLCLFVNLFLYIQTEIFLCNDYIFKQNSMFGLLLMICFTCSCSLRWRPRGRRKRRHISQWGNMLSRHNCWQVLNFYPCIFFILFFFIRLVVSFLKLLGFLHFVSLSLRNHTHCGLLVSSMFKLGLIL